MHADPKQVAARRWKRRLKAAGSLALAALAGAFVACQRGVQSFQEATAPAITPAPEKGDAATDTTGLASPAPLLADARADARADSLAVVPSPSARDAGADAYVMDAKEHRKGLPVPDYIVE